MIPINLMTPQEVARSLALKLRAKRLEFDWSQETLSQRSGVSYGVLKKFERTGQISLMSLLKLAICLNALQEFSALFPAKRPQDAVTLDELIKDKPRQRGRK